MGWIYLISTIITRVPLVIISQALTKPTLEMVPVSQVGIAALFENHSCHATLCMQNTLPPIHGH